jgi:hypothetical protein
MVECVLRLSEHGKVRGVAISGSTASVRHPLYFSITYIAFEGVSVGDARTQLCAGERADHLMGVEGDVPHLNRLVRLIIIGAIALTNSVDSNNLRQGTN